MIATLEALVLLLVLVGGIFVYRYLIRSKWFTQLIGGVEIPPTTDDEVVTRMTTAEQEARLRLEPSN
jgi:hypothetical protein